MDIGGVGGDGGGDSGIGDDGVGDYVVIIIIIVQSLNLALLGPRDPRVPRILLPLSQLPKGNTHMWMHAHTYFYSIYVSMCVCMYSNFFKVSYGTMTTPTTN